MSTRSTSAAAPSPIPSQDEGDGRHLDPLNRWWLRGSLFVVAGLVLAAATMLATLHVEDRYGLDHVSGARMALAQYFNEGTIYPELSENGLYGGTRWMPLPTIMHGLVARLTGEYLVSGKVVSYMSMAAVLFLMWWVMRRLRTPPPLAFALTGTVLVTGAGLTALMDLRFDTFPLALQILALEIIVRNPRTSTAIGAAALTSLALFSKVSAVWGAIAIVVWLLLHQRRLAARFALAYAACAGALLFVFGALTEGRIIENVFGLSASGISGLRSLILAPVRLLDLLASHAITLWALVPLAAFAGWQALQKREPSIYLLGLLGATAVLLPVLADIGTGWNQLVDVVVLVAIVVGELGGRIAASREAPDSASNAAMAAVLAMSVLWVDGAGSAVVLLPAVKETLAAPDAYSSDPLDGLATPGTSILSEDPYISVSLGQDPVVLDPFMLLRIGREDQAVQDELIQRIEAREFDLVVLVVPLRPVEQRWWSDYHFGVDVMRAIARSYVSRGKVQGYYVYARGTDGA